MRLGTARAELVHSGGRPRLACAEEYRHESGACVGGTLEVYQHLNCASQTHRACRSRPGGYAGVDHRAGVAGVVASALIQKRRGTCMAVMKKRCPECGSNNVGPENASRRHGSSGDWECEGCGHVGWRNSFEPRATLRIAFACVCGTETRCRENDVQVGSMMKCLGCKDSWVRVQGRDGKKAWALVDRDHNAIFDEE